MNDLFYANIFELDGKEGSATDPDGRPVRRYRGTFTTDSLNSYAFKMSEGALRRFQGQLDAGKINVKLMHGEGANSIGRIVSATYHKGKVKGIAELIEGITDPNSDDVIKLIENDVYHSWSVGWAGGELTCDLDSELMDKGLFLPMCSNGHALGDKLENGSIVTATLGGDVRLREVSVVDKPADPGADVIQALSDAGYTRVQLEKGCMIRGFDFANTMQALSAHNSDNKGDESMSDMRSIAEKAEQEKIEGLQAENDKLKEQLKNDYVSLEEYESLQRELADVQVEMKTLKDANEKELSEIQHLAKQGEFALREARELTMHAYVRYRGSDLKNKNTDKEYEKMLDETNGCTDLHFLNSQRKKFNNAAGRIPSHKETYQQNHAAFSSEAIDYWYPKR